VVIDGPVKPSGRAARLICSLSSVFPCVFSVGNPSLAVLLDYPFSPQLRQFLDILQVKFGFLMLSSAIGSALSSGISDVVC